MANLAVRGHDLAVPRPNGARGFDYPGHIKLLWDNENMRVTNFDDVNQYVKRTYRQGWDLKA
jgi:hypothetical protein